MTNPFLKQGQARVGMVARKWTLDELIDVGGMASVYRATHRNGNRVAVKVMHKQYADMPDAKERFLREGYVANKVGHPGAVAVLDDDQLDNGIPFLVMELLEGCALSERLDRKKTLSPAEILYVCDQLLDVLASAHERDIIHRDIKPGNVYLTTDGRVKLLDFGLARVLDRSKNFTLTRTGTVIGTASYMSPEQARGKRELIDHRTDIFATGALIFRALSGRNVHTAHNPMDRLLAAMSNHAASLAEVTENAPADLVALTDRALAFQKTDRWPNARAMQMALRQVYEANMGMPVPSAKRVIDVAGWTVPSRASSRRPSGVDDVHVSVSIEAPETGDSIFVEFDDDRGKSGRYALRRKTDPALKAVPEEELSEVSVVVLDDD